jgi:hypothetical protein
MRSNETFEMLTKTNRLGRTGVFNGTLEVQEHIFEHSMVDAARGTVQSRTFTRATFVPRDH